MPNQASGESLAEVWGPPCIRHSSQPEWWCGRNTLPAIWGGGKAAAIGATSSSSEENNAVSMLLIEPIMDIARGEGAAASGPVGTLWQGRRRKAGATKSPRKFAGGTRGWLPRVSLYM